MKSNVKRNLFLIFGFFAVCAAITAMGLAEAIPVFMCLFFFLGITFLLYFVATPYLREENDVYLFWFSYGAKLVYAMYRFMTKYGASSLAPHLSKDARRFWSHATILFNGGTVSSDTRFPYVLNFEFHLFGKNLLCFLLFNIFLTMLMMILVIKLLDDLNVRGKPRFFALLAVGFLPYEIIVSCSVLREPIYFFFITLSFAVYYRYVKNGKFLYLLFSMVLLLPVLLLHTGYFPIAAVYFFDSFRHDRPKTKLDLIKRLSILLALVAIVSLIMQMDDEGAGYFNRGISGLITKATGEDSGGYADEAGSRYLAGLTINSVPALILYTPIRWFFFLFSPLPINWRGPTDIIAFLLDGCVHFYVIYSTIKAKRILKLRAKATSNPFFKERFRILSVGLSVVLFIALMFSLNTNNSGTAIRHRDVLIGIEAVVLGLSLNTRKEMYFYETTQQQG